MPRTSSSSRDWSPAAQIAAAVVAICGFLPIANWIPGGRSAVWYDTALSGWLSGSAIVVGLGIVGAILSRRSAPLWREGALRRPIAAYDRSPVAWSAAIAIAGGAAYALIARFVFDAKPLLIDELAQVMQAQIYARGALSLPTPPHPEFFSSIHMVDAGGRVFSQFPAGGPAVLALGVIVGVPWLVGPVCGALAVLAFAAFVRVAEPRPGVQLGATVLFAFAPFGAFMSGSHMNHVPALLCVVAAIACMARVVSAPLPVPRLAFASGLAFGCAATIRPVDALAFALPAGLWYLWRALRERSRWADALPAAAGVALPMLALMWVNVRTTGAPLRFGYEVLWGQSHSLGFHAAPWGEAHTPALGLELVNLYFLRLQSYLFETPIPSLVPCIAALALTRRLTPIDRYLLASAALLVGLYFAYWHDGFYLGPRFVYLLLPALALWTARFLPLLRERTGDGLAYRTAVYGSVVAAAMALAVLVPLRAREYARLMLPLRFDVDRAAAAAGVGQAVVLVRESWGAQLMARMWALGVSRPQAERIYRDVDACALEEGIGALERAQLSGPRAAHALLSLRADSARVVRTPFSADTTERYLPGRAYSRRCARRIAADQEGFTLLAPLLLAHGGGNVYVRDLAERDTLVLREYPDRPVFLLRPSSTAIGALPRFYSLSRDSLVRAWTAAPPGQ